MEYAHFAVVVFLIILVVSLSYNWVYYLKLARAKKTIQEHKDMYRLVMETLSLYYKIVSELRKQGLAMIQGEDEIDLKHCRFQSRWQGPSGATILVQTSWSYTPRMNDSDYTIYIGVNFPDEFERGEPADQVLMALRRAIAKETRKRFPFYEGNCSLHYISTWNLPGVAHEIADAVRFYERAIEKSIQQQDISLPLFAQQCEAKLMREKLVEINGVLQNKINEIIASLEPVQKPVATS